MSGNRETKNGERKERNIVGAQILLGGWTRRGRFPELRVQVLHTVNPIEWSGQGPGAPLSASNARKLGI